MLLGAASNDILALLWRERIKVRVVRLDLALTLSLSRQREREIISAAENLFRIKVSCRRNLCYHENERRG